MLLQNGSEVPLRDSNDGNAKYRQGMSRRTQEMNDFGPASANSATIIYIDLSMVSVMSFRILGIEEIRFF